MGKYVYFIKIFFDIGIFEGKVFRKKKWVYLMEIVLRIWCKI